MSDEKYGMTDEQYWAWQAERVCEGCGAIPDQQHRPDCSVWLATLQED